MSSSSRSDGRSPPSERTSREMERIVADGERHLVAFVEEGAVSHPLPKLGALTVGRSADCDVQVERATLSRRHFVVRGSTPAVIEDLGSANGTRVNGRALQPRTPAPLDLDALVEAGGAFFVLRTRRGAQPAVAPADAMPLHEELVARGVVASDPVIIRLHALVREMGPSLLPVLLLGETGVGKEVFAAAVHANSPRARMPFQRINCAALPEALLESELFGYEAGAFTGAAKAKPGLVEAADHGTFFFDEIGEMPLTTQAKLLRLLESREILRVGGLRPRTVDVRFVAATNQNLEQRIKQGTFRRDLFYRLNAITITIPPLRDRHGEIADLARAFARRAAAAMGRPPPVLSGAALAILERHPWPGNVRELKHVVERAVALCAGDAIVAEDVTLDPPAAGTAERAPALTDERAEPRDAGGLLRVGADQERARIVDALQRAGGNQKRAAELLGISRRTLLRRLDEHAVDRPRKGRG